MTTDPKPLEAWALQAARKVAGDLNDRSGFDLGALDEEIELEIHEAWADIIAREARELVRRERYETLSHLCGAFDEKYPPAECEGLGRPEFSAWLSSLAVHDPFFRLEKPR